MPKHRVRPKKVRLQLDVSPAAAEQLEVLRARLDASSKAEVIRRAVQLLDYASANFAGGTIVYRDGEGEEVPLLPMF